MTSLSLPHLTRIGEWEAVFLLDCHDKTGPQTAWEGSGEIIPIREQS